MQQQYQYQYVNRDDSCDQKNNYKKYNNNNKDERNNVYRNKKQFNRNEKAQEYSQPILQRAQINQPENQIYDAQTIIKCFNQSIAPPQEFKEWIIKMPIMFTTIPHKPIFSTIQINQHEDDEPEWMSQTNLQVFEFQDIENELTTKRVQYQKEHGTYEKKQEEKNIKIQEQNQIIENEQIEIEKEKYRQIREKEIKKQQQEDETKSKLNELFSISQQQQKSEPIIGGIKVEELEQKQLLNKEKQQFNKINKEANDFYQFLEQQLGIKVNEEKKQIVKEPLFKQEQIQKMPFTLQAILKKKQKTDKLWYYIDNSNKIQGGFSSNEMDVWLEHKYLKPKLKLSWESPGKWITLEQFLKNLEQIRIDKLDSGKAMDQQSIITNGNSKFNDTTTQYNNGKTLQQQLNINQQFQLPSQMSLQQIQFMQQMTALNNLTQYNQQQSQLLMNNNNKYQLEPFIFNPQQK